jgi:DNA-directed RNA polymerase specialized sigma24 family protein
MDPKKPKTLAYEDLSDTIDQEIVKRRGSWYMDNIPALDWDDVAQKIRAHISVKWHLWDQSREFKCWVNTVISNQLKNIYRNNYANYMPPCMKCPLNKSSFVEDGQCTVTTDGKWGPECGIYAKWQKRKKHAWNIKIPSPLEHHDNEIITKVSVLNVDMEQSVERIHAKMKEKLSPKKFQIYKMLYIDFLEKEDVAKAMGYKSTEKNRKAGYKHIKNMEKTFTKMAKDLLEDGLI